MNRPAECVHPTAGKGEQGLFGVFVEQAGPVGVGPLDAAFKVGVELLEDLGVHVEVENTVSHLGGGDVDGEEDVDGDAEGANRRTAGVAFGLAANASRLASVAKR